MYFDFRDLYVSEAHYFSCLEIAVSRLTANQLPEIFTSSKMLTAEDIEKTVTIGQLEESGLLTDKDLIAVCEVRNLINRLT